jgi:KRAB domain-containing zinc finger protein
LKENIHVHEGKPTEPENQIKEKFQQEDPLNISNSNSVDLEGEQFVLEKNEQKDSFKCGYFKCPFCQRAFEYFDSVNMHIGKIHGPGKTKTKENIEKCEACFSDKKSLSAHISKDHSQVTINMCQICGLSYNIMYKCKHSLKENSHVHEGKPTEPENQIKEKFQQEDPLNISNSNSVDLERDQFVLEKNEHKDTFKCGYLRCPFCLIDFSRKQSLDIHVRKLHGAKKPIENFEKCESCFSDKKSLNAHVSKAHIGSKLHRCQICGFRYKNKLELKKHIIDVHEEKKAPLNEENACSLCIGRFNDKEDLLKHYAAVHERPQKCETCGKEFTGIGNLNKHIARVHAGKEKNHINEVHEGEMDKRHKCSLCTFSFKYKKNLQVHLHTVHEGKNPFQCSICCNIFTDRNLLKEHVLTVHEGHKPYKCDICLSIFNKKYSLKTHIESVHEGKFDCVICGSRFINEKKLHHHIENVHERKKQGEKNIFQCPNPKCVAKFKGRYLLVKHTRQCSYGPKVHEGNKPCNNLL